MTSPASSPPAAPATFIDRSETPCTAGRAAGSTDVVSIAAAAMTDIDHPRPSSTRPIMIWCSAWLEEPAVPETSVETARVA